MPGAAVSAGKSLRDLSRALRRGAARPSPARIATRVDPGLIPVLAARLGRGSALVTGTRGTTTTTRIMAAAVRSAGLPVITNLDGSSLLSGIAASLAARSGPGGALGPQNAAVGLFEVDEGELPAAIGMLDPRLVVITNLFCDQQEGHVEAGFIANRWQLALRGLPPDACVVLNADDPAVAYLGESLRAEVAYFGLDDRQWARSGRRGAAGSRRCPRCGHDLRYKLSFYAHLGHYACERCGWRRPDPRFAARRVDLGAEGGRCQMSTPTGDRAFPLPLAGLYDASHVLAATAGACCLGAGPAATSSAARPWPGPPQEAADWPRRRRSAGTRRP
jgi:lipid II isoglutaminyl synthase (glutamine-hydrolysing)